MMETSILNQLPFDPGFLILGLIGLVLITDLFDLHYGTVKKSDPQV